MSRNVSATFRAAAYAPRTDEVPLFLLKIDHADLDEPIYLVGNTENITSNGTEHTAFPFEIDFPGDSGEQITQTNIRIDNVEREIIATIRSLTSKPTMELKLILASDRDTTEAGPWEFSLESADYNQLLITGTLGFEDVLNQAWPGYSFTPAVSPGLFS